MNNDENYMILPYKQRVTGSNPVAPTPIKTRVSEISETFFYFSSLKITFPQKENAVLH